jgi:spore germination protein
MKMRSKALLAALFCLMALALPAQKNALPKGPHQLQQEAMHHPEFKDEDAHDRAQGITHNTQHVLSHNCILQKQVYGWHPAWSGTAYQQYDYALLTTVGYYSYEVDAATGGAKTIHQWRETQMVEMAHNAGSQVELTASLFGKDVGQLLKNPKACKTLCDSLFALVQYKDADGVCLDFQGLQPANKAAFVTLVDSLAATLRAWRAEATITVTLPALDVLQAYDIQSLSRNVNRFIVMAYDFHTATSAQAGPVAPLHGSDAWGETGLGHSLRQYIDAGAPKNKLLAGVPYYGYRWPVAGNQVPAQATGLGETVLLRDYEAMDSSAFLSWDSSSVTGWLQSAPRQLQSQLWIDQVSSLNEKYSSIKAMGIAGVGIWALGYDNGSDRYWNLLKGQFADCGAADADELNRSTDTRHPGLRGETSAERNVWNWVWMLGGGVVSILIIWLVKKHLK